MLQEKIGLKENAKKKVDVRWMVEVDGGRLTVDARDAWMGFSGDLKRTVLELGYGTAYSGEVASFF